MFYCKLCKKNTVIPHTITTYKDCKDCKCKIKNNVNTCEHKPRNWVVCVNSLEKMINKGINGSK